MVPTLVVGQRSYSIPGRDDAGHSWFPIATHYEISASKQFSRSMVYFEAPYSGLSNPHYLLSCDHDSLKADILRPNFDVLNMDMTGKQVLFQSAPTTPTGFDLRSWNGNAGSTLKHRVLNVGTSISNTEVLEMAGTTHHSGEVALVPSMGFSANTGLQQFGWWVVDDSLEYVNKRSFGIATPNIGPANGLYLRTGEFLYLGMTEGLFSTQKMAVIAKTDSIFNVPDKVVRLSRSNGLDLQLSEMSECDLGYLFVDKDSSQLVLVNPELTQVLWSIHLDPAANATFLGAPVQDDDGMLRGHFQQMVVVPWGFYPYWAFAPYWGTYQLDPSTGSFVSVQRIPSYYGSSMAAPEQCMVLPPYRFANGQAWVTNMLVNDHMSDFTVASFDSLFSGCQNNLINLPFQTDSLVLTEEYGFLTDTTGNGTFWAYPNTAMPRMYRAGMERKCACLPMDSIITVVPQGTMAFAFGSLSQTANGTWDFGDGSSSNAVNPQHTYFQAGTYAVSYCADYGCGPQCLSTTVVVQCPANTVAGFTSRGTQVREVAFTNTCSGFAAGSGSATWDFGDGTTSNVWTPTHTFPAMGSYNVCITLNSPCGSSTFCQVVNVQCAVQTSFQANTNDLTANFNITGSTGSSRTWDFGDGSTASGMAPSHTYAQSGTYTVCLLVTDSCGWDTACQTINVVCPPPANHFALTTTGLTVICTPDILTSNYSWDFGDGTTASIASPSHTYTLPGTYTVCLTMANGCTQATFCRTVTLGCQPANALFSSSISNLSVTLSPSYSAIPGTSSWSFGDGTYSNVSNPSKTYSSPGTYNICLVKTNACGSDTFCSVVNLTCPSILPNFGISINNLSVFFAAPNYQGTFFWDFGDGTNSTLRTPTHAYASSGTYTVCLTMGTPCGSRVECRQITVLCPAPIATFTYVPGGLTLNLSSAGSSPGTKSWNYGNGVTNSLGSVTYTASGSYQVCLTITNACGSSTYCQQVYVGCQAPLINFNYSTAGLNASFNGLPTSSGLSHYWNFGNGQVASGANPSITYSSPGTYEVCLTISSGCGITTYCKMVTVNCQLPAASFTTSASNTTVSFSNTSIWGQMYSWNFGDGMSSNVSSPTHTYANPGTYFACLVAANGCGSTTVCRTVVVTCALPTSSFIATTNLLQASFTNSSIGSTTQTWQFGDGTYSTSNSPVHTYPGPGTYQVCLLSGNGCGQLSSCQQVVVTCPSPQASFSANTNLLQANFSNASTGSSTHIWRFGDGDVSTAPSPVHVYAAPGTYNVCLVSINPCGRDSVCQPVTITCPAPVAAFTKTASQLQVSFNNASSGANSQVWYFGDGGSSTLASPSYTYPSPGTYTACLVSINACGTDSTCQVVNVTCPAPVSVFSGSSNLLQASFTNNSTGGLSQLWQFGDGGTSTAISPTHSYLQPGTYNVCLVTNNACGSSTQCQTITITCPKPNGSFSSSSNLLQASFSNGTSNAMSYSWNFGDGTFSNQVSPAHAYASPGTYTVCLISTNACGNDTSCQQVTITCPAPSSLFFANANLLQASFSNNSTGAVSQAWQFGDGATSTAFSPTHSYANPGTYQVCLVSTNSCGSHTVCQQVTVVCPKPTSSFSNTTNLLQANFINSSSDANSSYWQFGDGTNSNVASPSHTYALPGTYNVCLITSNSCGFDTLCQNITLTCAVPMAAFTSTNSQLQVSFSNASTGAQSQSWDFGDGTFSTQTSPTHTYSQGGTYQVCLTSTNSCGTSQVCQQVTVNCPVPLANFSGSSNGLVASFSNSSTGASSQTWDFGDGNTSSAHSPNHTYALAGSYNVCLITTNACGSDTSCHTFVLSCAVPVASFTASPSQLQVAFSNGSTGATSQVWLFGDGTTSSDASPLHAYAQAGTYTVCLVSTNACGNDTLCQQITLSCPSLLAMVSYTNVGNTYQFASNAAGTATNYAWDFGDGVNSNAPNPSHTYVLQDSFQVCLTVWNDCDTLTDCEWVSLLVTGVEHVQEDILVEVFPQPAHENFQLNVVLPSMDDLTIRVFDAAGRLVDERSHSASMGLRQMYDVGNWASGIYHLEMNALGERIVKRVLVQH